MKLKFNLKNKEVSLETDVEKLIEKGMDQKAKKPPKKTRYQISQEEKRKNEELKQKHFIQGMFLLFGIVAIGIVMSIICSIFSI